MTQISEDVALDLMARPQASYASVIRLPGVGPGVDDDKVAEQVEIDVKYSGYLRIAEERRLRTLQDEEVEIPALRENFLIKFRKK